MAKTPPNPSIGTSACPMRDCDKQCTVHAFLPREKKPANSRFAGRYFLKCPDHGRIGIDPTDSKLQAWIKANAKLDGAAAPAKAAPVAPADKAAPSKPKKKSKSVAAKPATPAPKEEPAPAPPVQRKSWLGGW